MEVYYIYIIFIKVNNLIKYNLIILRHSFHFHV